LDHRLNDYLAQIILHTLNFYKAFRRHFSPTQYIAVEANDTLANDLRGLSGIEVFNCAVAGEDGPLMFSIEANSEASRVTGQPGERSKMVEGQTLETLLRRANVREIDLLKVDVEGWRRVVPRASARAGGVAQPRDDTDVPSPVGSPVARNAGIFSLALAFREKAHRSIIMPPSPVARCRNGCIVSVLLSTKTSTSGRPLPPHRSYEVQTTAVRFKLFPSIRTSQTVR